MRRLTLTAFVGLVLVAGCGATSGSSDYAGQLRAAASKTNSSGSSKLQLTSSTSAQGQLVVITGTGAFDYSTKQGTIDLHLAGGSGGQGVTISERITGGNLFLALPNAPGSFYKIKLTDVTGTSLASGTDPSSSFSTLVGVSIDVTKVGTEKLRGTATTHYRGTIDVEKALTALTGTNRDLAQKSLLANGVKMLPFDAYLDGEGRLRKFVQHVAVISQGKKAESTTTIELYDFGTKVVVPEPPAAQVKDGAPLLAALKGSGS